MVSTAAGPAVYTPSYAHFIFGSIAKQLLEFAINQTHLLGVNESNCNSIVRLVARIELDAIIVITVVHSDKCLPNLPFNKVAISQRRLTHLELVAASATPSTTCTSWVHEEKRSAPYPKQQIAFITFNIFAFVACHNVAWNGKGGLQEGYSNGGFVCRSSSHVIRAHCFVQKSRSPQ